jgi:flavin reductase
MITQQAFRDGMARLAAAVHVVTTDGPGGRGGFTASAVCSVTDDPPTLLVCVNLHSRQNDLIRANGVLCVNTLAAGQSALAGLFSARELSIEERYAAGTWTLMTSGAPALEGAVASFDCRVVERLERGSHAVLFCEVQAVRLRPEAELLVYADRGYHKIEGGPRHSD